MENKNNDFTDFGPAEYDYGSTDVDLNDDKTYPVIVGSQGKSTENVEHNVDDDSYNNDGSHDNASDDDGCSGDYSEDDKGEDDESEGDEGDNNLDEDDVVVVGEEMVRINSLTADGIRAMEFAGVVEADDFYFKYGKCKGFYVRKSDIRCNVNDEIVMRQYVCNKQGLREKKHLSRSDRQRDHRRLTRTKCPSRLRVHYRPKKGRYVVSISEEGHNHELTPSSVVHLHPVYRKISETDKAQIDGLQSHEIRTCHIMGYMVA
ncbi:protein FAR1-RELATED SEQUENCE 11 [Medicago truncatula]|uniref:protein FAR1-RELATED SEQUENCE 11 n=1 Tax=Medicago truncatula TaxID=3880 RepID=UPI000D2F20DE|nr:protein FAR1-RELATED SEQUENCE 11 [Medicago truncatula]